MGVLACSALPLHLINFAEQVQKVELVGQKAAVDSFTGLGACGGKAGIASATGLPPAGRPRALIVVRSAQSLRTVVSFL